MIYRDNFFPDWVNTACPPIRLNLTNYRDGVSIRNPLLVPFQVIGSILGISAFWIVGLELDLVPPSKDLETHWAWSPHWNWAFLFFAIMNAVSIMAHNLLAPSTSLWDVFWRMDVVTTGLCAINLAVIGYYMIYEYIRAEEWIEFDSTNSCDDEVTIQQFCMIQIATEYPTPQPAFRSSSFPPATALGVARQRRLQRQQRQ